MLTDGTIKNIIRVSFAIFYLSGLGGLGYYISSRPQYGCTSMISYWDFLPEFALIGWVLIGVIFLFKVEF